MHLFFIRPDPPYSSSQSYRNPYLQDNAPYVSRHPVAAPLRQAVASALTRFRRIVPTPAGLGLPVQMYDLLRIRNLNPLLVEGFLDLPR